MRKISPLLAEAHPAERLWSHLVSSAPLHKATWPEIGAQRPIGIWEESLAGVDMLRGAEGGREAGPLLVVALLEGCGHHTPCGLLG